MTRYFTGGRTGANLTGLSIGIPPEAMRSWPSREIESGIVAQQAHVGSRPRSGWETAERPVSLRFRVTVWIGIDDWIQVTRV
jgi:hypothetical protein